MSSPSALQEVRKLGTMLFSTSVDPHWFKSGDKFWYSYKTGDGTRWYVVDPATRAAASCGPRPHLPPSPQKPFATCSLPPSSLSAISMWSPTATPLPFEVVSSQDAPKKSTEGLTQWQPLR